MGVTLRAVESADQATIRQWASAVADGMSRTRPLAAGADRHDPASGLHWYVIAADDLEVGTVWIEVPPPGSEGVLGIYLGDESDRGRGVGTAAIDLAVAEFRRTHPRLRAVACYRRAGFAITGHGSKTLPSGEVVPYHRMVLPAC